MVGGGSQDGDQVRFGADVAVHAGFARRFGGPVLELACGTGRLLEPLARSGFVCTGVDSSPAMLERARRRLANVPGTQPTLVEQRLEDLDLGRQFRTIIVGLDSFGLLLKRADQVRALKAAKAQATHDGRLVLDVANGNLRGAVEPPEELIHDLTMADPESARPITKFVLRRARPADQVDELMFFYDEQDERGYLRRSPGDLRWRWFTRFEPELLLQSAGWQVVEVYGNYDLEPYRPTSDRLLGVAR